MGIVSPNSSPLRLYQQRKAVEDRTKKMKEAMKKTGLNKKQLVQLGKMLNSKQFSDIIDFAQNIGKFGKDLIEHIHHNELH